MATTTLGLTRYSVFINIKCLKWSSIHINDVVLIGRSKTELFWYRKMAHFAIKLPRYTFPLTFVFFTNGGINFDLKFGVLGLFELQKFL